MLPQCSLHNPRLAAHFPDPPPASRRRRHRPPRMRVVLLRSIPCRHSLLVDQVLFSHGKPLESLISDKLFARLWLTSSFEAGQLYRARSHLFAFIRRAGPSTSAAEPSTTWSERVQMLVNETRHLAQLAAKVPALMAEMRRAVDVLYRKAAGLPELETLQFVTVSGSARTTAAAASGAASFAAGQAGAQPTSALPPLSAHGAGRKRGSRIQNEGEAPKKARGRGGGSRVT
mmetsp:Transcript_34702/g.81864  ORF Transcript_34702/g.81864 Transcript_34702/m.81864 type:complete len:230 (-) Transcript_34702:192-881(-)